MSLLDPVDRVNNDEGCTTYGCEVVWLEMYNVYRYKGCINDHLIGPDLLAPWLWIWGSSLCQDTLLEVFILSICPPIIVQLIAV